MAISVGGIGNDYSLGNVNGLGSDVGGKSTPGECETCKNRKYQDGSNENVSFKAAAHISPQASASVVMGHESEHVSNAYTKASQDGGKVISAGVSLQTAVCPECGRTYVAGGVTRTTIKYPGESQSNPYTQQKMANDADYFSGANVDVKS